MLSTVCVSTMQPNRHRQMHHSHTARLPLHTCCKSVTLRVVPDAGCLSPQPQSLNNLFSRPSPSLLSAARASKHHMREIAITKARHRTKRGTAIVYGEAPRTAILASAIAGPRPLSIKCLPRSHTIILIGSRCGTMLWRRAVRASAPGLCLCPMSQEEGARSSF